MPSIPPPPAVPPSRDPGMTDEQYARRLAHYRGVERRHFDALHARATRIDDPGAVAFAFVLLTMAVFALVGIAMAVA